jgi:hypothetical protein
MAESEMKAESFQPSALSLQRFLLKLRILATNQGIGERHFSETPDVNRSTNRLTTDH